eukprot:GAHX01003817.1.p1 GENE.GAHX01003817.1~~GAHX01003817.1.p1  ORF type:complete len:386 (-),score=54.93 GAHX01003817.1:6-1163(-)
MDETFEDEPCLNEIELSSKSYHSYDSNNVSFDEPSCPMENSPDLILNQRSVLLNECSPVSNDDLRKTRTTMTPDLIIKLKECLFNNEKLDDIVKWMGVGKSTIYKYKRLFELDEKVVCKTRSRRKNQKDSRLEDVTEILLQGPLLTTMEIREKLDYSVSAHTISTLILKGGFTRKRVKLKSEKKNSEENLVKQKNYLTKVMNVPNNELIFLDEAGFNRHIVSSYGYSPRSTECCLEVPASKGKSITLLMAVSLHGTVAFTVFEGPCDTDKFSNFYVNELYRRLQQDKCKIIMDNAAIHRSMINRLGIDKEREPIFLPPYSPELNPIEEVFHEIKTKFRKITPLCKNKEEIIDRVEMIVNDGFIIKDFTPYYEHMRENMWKLYKKL